MIDFQDEPYIFSLPTSLVYEELLLILVKFDIRWKSIALVPPLVFRGHFLHTPKFTLRLNRFCSFLNGTLTWSIGAYLPNMDLQILPCEARGWGHIRRTPCKLDQCDTHHSTSGGEEVLDIQ